MARRRYNKNNDQLHIFMVVLTVICFLAILAYLISISIIKEGFATELHGKVAQSAHKLVASEKNLKNAPNPNVRHMIAQEMILVPDGKPSQSVIEHTEMFHKAFEDNKSERIGTLGKIYKELGSPKTTIILFYCKKFFIFFKNWVMSCEKNNIPIRDKTITFALDQEAYNDTVFDGIQIIPPRPQ